MLRIFLASVLILVNLYADSDLEPAVDAECKVICEKCGFYMDRELDYLHKLRASYENEDDYYTIMDDWVHYLYTTDEYLEANVVGGKFYGTTVEQCPTLNFDGYTLDISKIDSPFIYIIYQKGKKPHIIKDITIPEDEINSYFNITNPKLPKKQSQ